MSALLGGGHLPAPVLNPKANDTMIGTVVSSGSHNSMHGRMSAPGRVSRGSPVHTVLRNCTRDEGRSFEAGSQVQASNHCKLLSSKAMVVSVAVNVGMISRRVRLREASASEPSMNCRKRIRRCQNRGVTVPPGSAWGDVLRLPKRHPACRRREAQPGSCTERENLCSDAKGEISSGSNREDQSTDAEHRGGAARSRDEGSVMELDRRGCVVQPRPWANIS
jgi:hypothetical protein